MQKSILTNQDVTYLDDFFYDHNGKFILHTDDELSRIPQEHLSIFCHKKAIYGIPSTELIGIIQSEISLSSVIEIGAGCGIFGEILDIPMTDSYMQELPEVKTYYKLLNQPTITYGSKVEKIDAVKAVLKYKPQIVFGSWITHKYDNKNHVVGGNIFGVREEDILKSVNKYIMYGNHKTHRIKPLLQNRKCKIYKGDFMYSRSMSKSENCLYVWEN